MLQAWLIPLTITCTAQGSPDERRAPRELATASWIWPTNAVVDHQEAWFRKAFVLAAEPVKATLRGACDDRTNVYIDGELVAASAAWWTPYEEDVLRALHEGENVFAAWSQNVELAAGFWLELDVELANGTTTRVVTDSSWRASSEEAKGFEEPAYDDSSWEQAIQRGVVGGPPWGPPDAPTPFEPSDALPAEKLILVDGFRAELLYTVPRVPEGSWVCLATDERGRLYASDQMGSLYRIEPPPLGTTTGTRVERIDVDCGEAQGLAWADGVLYAVVNGQGHYRSGLWRITDRDHDDRLDTAELLAPIAGSGEHGPHAVRLAPDGRSLYVIAGNFTDLPRHVTKSRVTPVWGEDLLLPRIDDPTGHDVGVLAPGAWLCRTDFDGREWELVAAGMRNPYDFDFDPEGEAFTFDADMEWDTGMPWYRPTRIVHMVSGAEFGWRNGSGKWPPSSPDSLPPVVDIGLASPTGVAFGTHASFPERWRRALYAADWAYGTLYAVHLEPSGASFTGTFEVFARGKPFPITDVCIAPDGAMYVTTGGRQMQSALYRITATEPKAPPLSEPQAPPLSEPQAAGVAVASEPTAAGRAARAAREELEAAHGRLDPAIVPLALEWLSDPDRFVRYAARVALEHQPVESWAERALALADPRARTEAILALARVGPASARERLIACFESLPEDGASAEEVASSLRALELVLIRMGRPSAEVQASLAARLSSSYPSGEPLVDRLVCELLVWLEASDSTAWIEKTLDLVEGAGAQADKLHYATALRVLAAGWTEHTRRRYFAFLDDARAGLAGGHSFTLFLDQIRANALERCPDGERTELVTWLDARANRRGTRPATIEASIAPLPTSDARAWTAGDLQVLLATVGHARSFASGRAAFTKATCIQCHRLQNEGGSTGPDLTGAGNRFGRADLLDAILDPSRVISDQYQDQELVTTDERLLVGRIESEAAGRIRLRLLPPAEEVEVIEAADVQDRRPHPLSRMPSHLLDSLTEDEILDLFAYVLSGGDSTDAAFRHDE
jgi:putative heme-binding domain-containing protein